MIERGEIRSKLSEIGSEQRVKGAVTDRRYSFFIHDDSGDKGEEDVNQSCQMVSS